MLVAQAVRQFAWWTGVTPEARVLREAAKRGWRRWRGATAGGAGRKPDIGMKQTTFEEFVELATRGTFVPVYKEILADLLTPVSAFLKVAEHADYAFLLESVEGGEQVARYSLPRQGSVPRAAGARTARRSSSAPARRGRSTSRSSTRCAG